MPPTPLGDDAAAPAEVALAMVGAQAPVVLSRFDANGTVADLRGPLLDRLGLTPEAILGHHYADLDLPDAVGTCIARALGGEPAGTEVSLQDRDWAFEVRPVAGGGAVAVLTYDDETVAQDLATRREELEKFAALVELSADFIAMAEPDGTVTYLNVAGRELVGLGSHDEALGRPTDDYFTEAGRAKSHEVEEAVRTRGFWQGESELHHFGTGESIPVSVNSFLVTSPSTGEPLALATVQRDRRARIAAEHDLGRRLSEQRRIAELSRLAVTEPVHALVDQTVRLLHSRFPGLRCGVMQRSLDRHHFVTVSTTEPAAYGLSTRIDPATVSGAAVTLDRTTTSDDLGGTPLGARGRPAAPGTARPVDRPAQPGPGAGPDRARPGAGAPRRHPARRTAARPRRLQGGQRLARPQHRRPASRGGGHSPDRGSPAGRHCCPAGWRRVRGPVRGRAHGRRGRVPGRGGAGRLHHRLRPGRSNHQLLRERGSGRFGRRSGKHDWNPGRG